MGERFTHMEWLRRIGEDNCCIVPNATICLIADLRREAGELVVAQYATSAAEARAERAEAQLKAAREALEPFAEQSRRFDEASMDMVGGIASDFLTPHTRFTHAELRRAFAALRSLQPIPEEVGK